VSTQKRRAWCSLRQDLPFKLSLAAVKAMKAVVIMAIGNDEYTVIAAANDL
jgi:hypothetical protein